MGAICHRSGWVMPAPGLWVENGEVHVVDGRIAAVGLAQRRSAALDHGPGVIMRPLVNAHTHLSLSALAGRIDPSRGFVNWIRDLIQVRGSLASEEIDSAARNATTDVKNSGTGLVAEVGPVHPGMEALTSMGLHGVIFAELLGEQQEIPSLPLETDGLQISYAGHALHTTAPGLVQALKGLSDQRGRPFSLHLAESEAEVEFLATGHGPWADLLTSRGIRFSDWGPWGERPVSRAERLGLLGPAMLAVHLVQVTRAETAALARTGTSVCVCPRSNFALHGQLPDIEALLQEGLDPALGTDSLASAASLDVFEEMAFVAEKFPALKPQTILAMATVNGAKALGRGDLGTLRLGGGAGLIYVDLEADSAQEAETKLVTQQFNRVDWL